jgi:hypothetical protein
MKEKRIQWIPLDGPIHACIPLLRFSPLIDRQSLEVESQGKLDLSIGTQSNGLTYSTIDISECAGS